MPVTYKNKSQLVRYAYLDKNVRDTFNKFNNKLFLISYFTYLRSNKRNNKFVYVIKYAV